MARKVFFSFHYEDVATFRANVVRNSWVTHDKGKVSTFSDSSIWEAVKSKGSVAIKNLIDNTGLFNTSVSAVLIGSGTSNRKWVRYELIKSFERGNGILGVYINRIKDKTGHITSKGNNPLDKIAFNIGADGKKITFYELVESKWVVFSELPQINNKKSNTLYFEERFFTNSHWGKTYKFSQFFETYCWDNDNGYNNFAKWVEKSATQSGK